MNKKVTFNMQAEEQYQGDTNVQELPTLDECIESIVNKEGYITRNIDKKNISSKGGNFLGILYEIDVKGTTANGDKETNIFVKNIVSERDQMKIYSISDVYKRELMAYEKFSKIFDKLQDEANVPYVDRFKMAKCYNESNPEAIILENLAKKDYKVYNRMDVVSLEYAELSIQQLARFHGLSFVIQKRRPEYYERNIKDIKQPFIFGEDWNGFIKNMYDYSINCLNEDVKKSVKDAILEKIDKYSQYMKDTSRTCTLCHGDYKHNNIMVKEIDGKPSEVIPVDYALLHHGCPVIDILYFIFNGTDQEFRKAHLTNLKDLYYESLGEFLEKFNIEVQTVYPRKDFEEDFKKKLDFGLMINVFYVPFLFSLEDDAPDVTNQSLSTLSFKVDERFGERFRGVVDDFIRWGYL